MEASEASIEQYRFAQQENQQKAFQICLLELCVEVERNRELLERVLQGQASRPHSDVVALNAALVLWTASLSESIQAGLERARASLAAGEPWQRLLALRQALAEPAGG